VYKYTREERRDHYGTQADGWFQVAAKGSHLQFKHASKPGRVTVPHPKRDIPIGTLKSIEIQSELKLR
jgi:predicted RNA binding protein YcfA (HicA-like mRNA interferase family)